MGDDSGTEGRGAGRVRTVADAAVARWQAARVGRRIARGFDPHTVLSYKPKPFQALARTLWAAPEGGYASRAALRAAREAAANPFAVREFLAVFRAEAVGDPFGLGTVRLPARPVPPPVTAFLLEPVGEAVHRPGVRVVAFLDAPALPLPGPVRASHRELAEWLVHSAMAEEDAAEDAAGGFGPLSDLLARTDQPDLLNALATAFDSGAAEAGRRAAEPVGARGPGPYRLWKDTAPTLLHRVIMANPHLPALPPPGGERLGSSEGTALLLALFKGRHDLADRIVRRLEPRAAVSSLAMGVSLTGPEELTGACRRLLRRLDDPAARDEVCMRALYGDDREMRPAAVDAGYLPSVLDEKGKAAFLFATEQWERYDAADPGRRLVTSYFKAPPDRDTEWWW